MCVIPTTDKAADSREKLRQDTEDPNAPQLSTETDEPKRA